VAAAAFRLTSDSPRLLALNAGGAGLSGVLKPNGRLVRVAGDGARGDAGRGSLGAGRLTPTVDPAPEAECDKRDGMRHIEADLVFNLKDRLTVGYRGFYVCGA